MTEVKLLGGQGRGHYAEARLAEFVANCRRKKMAVTPQRLAVLRALLESGDHPRADRIYALVRRQHPRISLATVHRTLERLCDVGEARKVTPLHETARYSRQHPPPSSRGLPALQAGRPSRGPRVRHLARRAERSVNSSCSDVRSRCARCAIDAANALTGRSPSLV